jgi:Uma2 family endonuclease
MVARPSHVSYEEYLAIDAKADRKHEYCRGRVNAMAGGTPEHARLQANISSALRVALHGRPCAVFSSDLRVRVHVTDLSTYPDITVVCGALQTSPVDKNAVVNPVVLVEVTSDSSEESDRVEKFSHYRRLASLRECVVASGREARIEVWRKNERGRWEIAEEAGPTGSVRLESIDATLDVDAIYANPLAVS